MPAPARESIATLLGFTSTQDMQDMENDLKDSYSSNISTLETAFNNVNTTLGVNLANFNTSYTRLTLGFTTPPSLPISQPLIPTLSSLIQPNPTDGKFAFLGVQSFYQDVVRFVTDTEKCIKFLESSSPLNPAVSRNIKFLKNNLNEYSTLLKYYAQDVLNIAKNRSNYRKNNYFTTTPTGFNDNNALANFIIDINSVQTLLNIELNKIPQIQVNQPVTQPSLGYPYQQPWDQSQYQQPNMGYNGGMPNGLYSPQQYMAQPDPNQIQIWIQQNPQQALMMLNRVLMGQGQMGNGTQQQMPINPMLGLPTPQQQNSDNSPRTPNLPTEISDEDLAEIY